MEYTRIKNDINGNPRYVFHFLDFLTDQERDNIRGTFTNSITAMYNLACTKAKSIGGKRYRGKDFGGGIVFQSYNIQETIKDIVGILG